MIDSKTFSNKNMDKNGKVEQYMIKAVIFDMDGTLYNEREYVMSGFRAVAEYLSVKYKMRFNKIFEILKSDFDNGLRKRNFNVLVEKLHLNDEKIGNLVDIYRKHKPSISLYPDAEMILNEFKKEDFKLGLITDGYKESQENKISSLNLRDYFDLIIITDDYGKEYWKPSEKSFKLALSKFGMKPNETTYIGDNPLKDFVTAKKLGIYTIRIRRGDGEYDHIEADDEYEADYTLSSLLSLKELISKISQKGEII